MSYTQVTLVTAIGVAFAAGAITGAVIATVADSETATIAPEDDGDERRSTKKKRRNKPSAATAPEPTPPPKPKTIADQLEEATTLEQALAITRPMMSDTHNELDKGMAAFGLWSLDHLTWTDVAVVKDETTVQSTMKDPGAARGKRMCTRGSLIQIEVFDVDGKKGFEGLMWNHRRDLIKYIAVKSTGDLVTNSPARFCGVVTGKYSYANSAGGTGHAVAMVGMFDLPENRKGGAK